MKELREAIPHGGEVTLRSGFDPQNQRLILAVIDTREGIPHAAFARLFDPFFTTKPKGECTWLRLAVSQGIIHAYGGEITVESQVGVGPTFTIFLPLVAIPVEKQSINIIGRYQKSESGSYTLN
jgi:signal transduction histidine kinase